MIFCATLKMFLKAVALAMILSRYTGEAALGLWLDATCVKCCLLPSSGVGSVGKSRGHMQGVKQVHISDKDHLKK